MKKVRRSQSTKSTVSVIVGEAITDPDIKAVYLISEAMRISTPRMRRANLEFVLNYPKYNIGVKAMKTNKQASLWITNLN